MNAQAMDALALANRIRLVRAAAKRELGVLPRIAGLLAVGEIVQRPPDDLLTMPLYQLVCACRQMARLRAIKLLRHLRLPENATVGSLSDRQRGVFCEYVDGLRGTVEVVDLAPSQAVAA